MRVTRIELFGFKSFMHRAVISLEGGITGVVGPNGCGKSNIVDAIRWVLGETRARSLRGGVLEDVIFNGTDALRPLGLAEVTLTVRSDGPTFLEELVSPDREADLVMEGVLEDDLAQGEAGASGEGVVSAADQSEQDQGQAGERPALRVIKGGINSDSTENELAAEAMPTAKEEVVSDGEPTGGSDLAQQGADLSSNVAGNGAGRQEVTLLAKFGWLKGVSEVQITRRLYRSGESEFLINRVPCRLRDLKEFYRAIGLSARAYTVVAQGEVSRIVTSKPDERRLVLEEAAGIMGFRDRIAAARRRLEETTLNIARLDDIITEVSRQVQILKRQAARARNRQELKDRIQHFERVLAIDTLSVLSEQEQGFNARKERLLEQLDILEERLGQAKEDEHTFRERLTLAEAESESLRRGLSAMQESLRSRQRELFQRQARVHELQSLIAARAQEGDRSSQQLAVVEDRIEECLETVRILTEQEQSIQESISETQRSTDQGLLTTHQQLEEARLGLKRAEQELRELQEQFMARRIERDNLEQQLISFSASGQLAKTLGEIEAGPLRQLAENSSILIDALSVPPEYVRAVAAVLAEQAQFLVTKDPHSVAQAFVRESRHDSEQARGRAFGVIGKGVGQAHLPLIQGGEDLVALREVVSVAPEGEGIVDALISSVLVARDLDQAIAYFSRQDQQLADLDRVKVVTLDGDIVTANSFYSFQNDYGVLQLRSRKEGLDRECAELSGELQSVKERVLALEVTVEHCERAQAAALAEGREHEMAVRELSGSQGAVRGRLMAENEKLNFLRADRDRLAEQQSEGHEAVASYREELERIAEEEDETAAEQIEQLQVEIESAEEKLEQLEEERLAARTECERVQEVADRARTELDQWRTQGAEVELGLQRVSLGREGLRDRVVAEYGEEFWDNLLVAAEAVALQASEARDTSEASARGFSSGDEELEDTFERMASSAANTGVERLSSEQRSYLDEEVKKLRARIQREGEVDPASIEQYESEQARLDDLTAQRDDLSKARSILHETVSRLAETSKERFIQTFERVQRNFAGLGPRLFGGGMVALELTDPANPLESGVEVIARPPGKKLKSIELMSGGEKAMCATALILAMFMERPSPLCVLDEVDAPLDESNLGRFLNIIREMAEKTQFLIVTHSKLSMVAADNLVGVTMQQPGATTLLSVSVEQAVNQ